MDLLTRADKGYAVDVGHDGLFDDLSQNVAFDEERELVTRFVVFIDLGVDEIRDSSVDVLRLIGWLKVDLFCACFVASEGGVVLQSVTGSVLRDREMADVVARVGGTESFGECDGGGETLPGVFGLEPPPLTLEWIVRGIHNFFEVLVDKFYAVGEGGFVVTCDIGEMDLEPLETLFAEGFAFGEDQKTTREIISEMIQVGRNRVGATAEIDVVGKVELLEKELIISHQHHQHHRWELYSQHEQFQASS